MDVSLMLRALLGAGYGETVMVAVIVEAREGMETVVVEECELSELMAGRTSAMIAMRIRNEAMVVVVLVGLFADKNHQ